MVRDEISGWIFEDPAHPAYFRRGDNSQAGAGYTDLCFIKHFDHSAKKEPRQP